MLYDQSAKRLDICFNSQVKQEGATEVQAIENEIRFTSINTLKKSMGLYPDTFKANFAAYTHKL